MRTLQDIPDVLDVNDSEANILWAPFGERIYLESQWFSLMFTVYLLPMTGKCTVFPNLEDKPSPESLMDASTDKWEIRVKLLPDLGFSPHSLVGELTVVMDGERRGYIWRANSGFVLCFFAHLNAVLPETSCLLSLPHGGYILFAISTESIPSRSFIPLILHLRPVLQKSHHVPNLWMGNPRYPILGSVMFLLTMCFFSNYI